MFLRKKLWKPDGTKEITNYEVYRNKKLHNTKKITFIGSIQRQEFIKTILTLLRLNVQRV